MNENEIVESADDLQEQIDSLQKKLIKQQLNEAGGEANKITLPLATIQLKINKNNSVRLRNVTPPQAAFLVAEHQARAGGAPIEKIEMQKNKKGEQETIEVDPRSYRNVLSALYHPKKINALFPGMVPVFPLTFSIAVKSGLETTLPTERMMDYELVPSGGENA